MNTNPQSPKPSQIQFRGKAYIRIAKQTGIEIATLEYNIGPIKHIVIINLPEDRDEVAAYVKLEFDSSPSGWQEST